jgi:hypothetical protein
LRNDNSARTATPVALNSTTNMRIPISFAVRSDSMPGDSPAGFPTMALGAHRNLGVPRYRQ